MHLLLLILSQLQISGYSLNYCKLIYNSQKESLRLYTMLAKFHLLLLIITSIIFILTNMDKTFNFFKTKIKKQNERIRNNSKSNSSKASGSKHSNKAKDQLQKVPPISQKQKQIRAAIQNRYQRSKLRNYRFELDQPNQKRKISSSHSSNCQQYQHLKKRKVVDIKQYHQKQQSIRKSQGILRESPANLKLKLGGTRLRTQGDQAQRSTINRSVKVINKNLASDNLSKKKDDWKYISIQVKQDYSKPKIRKPDMKINSQRSFTIQEGPRLKTNSSLQRGLDKPKPKETSKVNRF